jgi:hypothetical protein
MLRGNLLTCVIAHIYKSSLLHLSTLHTKGIFWKWFVWYIVVCMLSNSFQTIHVELVPPHHSVGYLTSFMCSPWANTHVWSRQHMILFDKTWSKFAQCTFHLQVDPRIRRSTLPPLSSHHVKKLTWKHYMCHTRLYIRVKLSLNYLDRLVPLFRRTSTIKKLAWGHMEPPPPIGQILHAHSPYERSNFSWSVICLTRPISHTCWYELSPSQAYNMLPKYVPHIVARRWHFYWHPVG